MSDTANWWDRNIVPHLIKCACSQGQIMKVRATVVPRAAGDVLELGCGGGINMEFYDRARVRSFSGVDPSPKLLEMSRAAAAEQGMTADIRGGVGEAMPFGDAMFDTVVTTFTLCSVQDAVTTLAEIRRVLRPGGTALFLEHGASPDANVAKWQRRIEPLWSRIGGGCQLTRPIAQAYANAGFTVDTLGRHYVPKSPRPMAWVEYGTARLG